jgi:hypothetical protein
MNKLTTEELLDLRKRLYKAWVFEPVGERLCEHHLNLSDVMDNIDVILRARNAWISYDADYAYATAKSPDTVNES